MSWIPTSSGLMDVATLLFVRGGATLPPPHTPPLHIAPGIVTTNPSSSTSSTTTNANANDNDNVDKNPQQDQQHYNKMIVVSFQQEHCRRGSARHTCGYCIFRQCPDRGRSRHDTLGSDWYALGDGFSLIGMVCAHTKSTSYRQAWS
jgi:hypothetical protein